MTIEEYEECMKFSRLQKELYCKEARKEVEFTAHLIGSSVAMGMYMVWSSWLMTSTEGLLSTPELISYIVPGVLMIGAIPIEVKKSVGSYWYQKETKKMNEDYLEGVSIFKQISKGM